MLPETLKTIFIIASKEFSDRIRNRWMLAVAVLFTLFSVAIAYFGASHHGLVGIQSIGPTIASLTSLVIYLVPLIALLLGFDAIVGERERGSLTLLLSMPLSRGELLFGKFLGLALAFTVATVIGFIAVGAILLTTMSSADVFHYVGFVFTALLLGYSFLSLAVLVSTLTHERSKASGLAIALWFFFVLVFDLLILGALISGMSRSLGEHFSLLLLLNPADVFRLLNVFNTEQVRAFYNLTSVLPEALSNTSLLMASALGWIIMPLLLALWRFKNEK